MKDEFPPFPFRALVRLGPEYDPAPRVVEVRVLRREIVPGFMRCVTARGEEIVVCDDKVKPIERE